MQQSPALSGRVPMTSITWRRLFDWFPYGKAPLSLLLIAILSTSLWFTLKRQRGPRPDLILVTFTSPHQEAYRKALPEFEKAHGVKVEVQLAQWESLQTRLQNAMLAETDVPDMVEMLEGSLGFFARGPQKDIGLLDLTARIDEEHLRTRMVESRFSLWSARGRILGLPHDVHPVMLAYRRDLVEQLGIDVSQLDTWDKFAEVGRRITKDLDGDGVIDRYMLDLPIGGNWAMNMLMLQRGLQLLDEHDNPSFATEQTAQLFRFYLDATRGPQRFAYDCGWGQPFLKAVSDGVVLFFITPDWRAFTYQNDLPNLFGRLALMPLPAWQKGGRRTSVWGGTGLVITRASRHSDLAWDLAKYLYLSQRDLGERFKGTGIIPPLKDAWALPEFRASNPFFSGQPVGKLYANLAPETPPVQASPIINIARGKVDVAYSRVIEHYKSQGEQGLMTAIERELRRADAEVRRMARRCQILQQGE